MQILTQKDEIEVSNLIGASRSFIRLPFLYAGITYGFFGGILTLVAIAFVIQIFNLSIIEISNLYSADFSLPLFNTYLSITIVSTAIFIGWLGSYLAVARSLASIKIN
jgi:cell division transport system permease protein